jgi:hypothetical protein
MAVARGIEWRGHRARQGNVGYICAEGARGFGLRLKAYCEHHGVDPESLPLYTLDAAPNIMDRTDVKDLVSALRELPKLDVLFIDTLAQVTPGANENSGEDMGRALSHCKGLAKAIGAMVVLIAHSGKDGDKGIRGWSGINAALDVAICVEREGDYRAASIVKMKDGEGEGAEYPFMLDPITLGTDPDGDAITSCVLKAVERAKPMPKGKIQRLVLEVAQDLMELTGGNLSETELINNTIAQIPFNKADGKRDVRKQNIEQAIENLIKNGFIRVESGFVDVI